MKLKIIALLFVACSAQAQVTLENLMNVPFPTNLVSSSDGKRIAWIFNDQGIRNIYFSDEPFSSIKQLTNYTRDEGQEIAALSFTPQDDGLIFVRGGAPSSQNDIPNPLALQEGIERAIWFIKWNGEQKKLASGIYPRISPDGKTIVYLSGGQVWSVPADGSKEGKKLFHARGSQSAVRWSPDGTRLAFISARGDHSFLGIYDFGSNTVQFPDASVDHDGHPVWSPDGKQVAHTRKPNVKEAMYFRPQREGSGWSIRSTDITTGKSKDIWKSLPGKGSVFHEGVPAIDNYLFWTEERIIFPWERDGWVHIYSVSENGGEPQLLTPGDGEVEQVSLSADKKSIITSTNIGDIDRRHIWKIDVKGNKAEQLSTGSGIEWNAVETTQGIACLRSDATTTAWPCVISGKSQFRMIAPERFPKSFPKQHLVTPQPVTITTSDGMKIPAQLFLPKAHKEGDKHPSVIFFHGGSRRQMLLGFNYGLYYHHAYSLNQYLASQGYVVLSVNYRSGIGYGLDFREALDFGAAGASEFNDVRGAGEYLKARPDVDGTRIGLWGGSYGGYLTALGLTRAPELFSCGVDIHGVHDWNVVIKNFNPSYSTEKFPAIAKKAFESSPVNYIKNWRAPVLLIHGDDDRNVPFSETVNLAESLREQNVYFEQLIFPDEVHSFLLYESWLKAYKASADFFKRQFEKDKGK
jgi:dipeptidyl aminopeptidase/acylaminoacyl peptidase